MANLLGRRSDNDRVSIVNDPEGEEVLQCAGIIDGRRCERAVARSTAEDKIATRGSRPLNYFDFKVNDEIWLAYEGSPGAVTRVYCQGHRNQRSPL